MNAAVARPLAGPSLRARVVPFVPALVWATVIFVLSAIPGDGLPQVEVRWGDKLAHAGVYGVLGWLLARALCGAIGMAPGAAIVAAAALATLYGVSDEFHQAFVPGRFPDLADGVADGIGGLLGACAFVAVAGWRAGRSAAGPGARTAALAVDSSRSEAQP